ncbi:type II toxin-antitoxin system VapB family antitoxin [uncultured Microbacterium sp.]|uniref:type II toxin-antitoxin system VapB family antitoxin n=1 Tax=uncultured Microbacterium sp. TaxID=191216 RepID=UPI00262F2261|nr:type II toxin-antitoxin system VapB family antitoxin [uncultured Microbacterium sp.]
MALNIKDPETDRIARELSAATGESITVAVRIAMEERLRRVRASGAEAAMRAEIDAIIARGRARAIVDEREPDDILGYDANGLPA